MFHICLCYTVLSLLVITCWERAEQSPIGSLVCCVFLCFCSNVYFFEVFVTFPCGVPGQVWYLILSILDLCFKEVSMAEWLVRWTTKLATWVRFPVAAGLPTVFQCWVLLPAVSA